MNTFAVIALCIVLFGCSTFFRKMALDSGIHPYQFQIVAALLYALILPVWWYLTNKNHNTDYSGSGIFYIVVCTAMHTVGAVLFGFLLKNSDNPGVLAALVSLSPMVTIGLSMLFLGEEITIFKVIAFLLAITSAILINF